MKLACLCPTYKRPGYLENVIACFEAQTYQDSHLFILDDANQITSQTGDRWTLANMNYRQPTLSAKFNVLSAISGEYGPDAYVIWEDDDIYLPDYLMAVNNALEDGGEFVAPYQVYSTYNQELGRVQREDATGRFHASWSFTRDLFERVHGYPDPTELKLTFDQAMRQRLLDETREKLPFQMQSGHYVYRWGNVGIPGYQIGYHGSSSGDEGFQAHWDALGAQQVSPVGKLRPRFDMETSLLYESLAGRNSDYVDNDKRFI